MLRKGQYKYVYYPDNPDQQFNVEADPDETTNLADDSSLEAIRDDLASELRGVADADAVDRRARRDQKRRLAELTAKSDGRRRRTAGFGESA